MSPWYLAQHSGLTTQADPTCRISSMLACNATVTLAILNNQCKHVSEPLTVNACWQNL